MKSLFVSGREAPPRLRTDVAWRLAGFLSIGLVGANSVTANVFNSAASFSLNANPAPGSTFAYGYLSSNQSTFSNADFLLNNSHGGFTPFPEILPGGGGPGVDGWSDVTNGFGFPFAGVAQLPENQDQIPDFPGLVDWPSSDGLDSLGNQSGYPNGVVGGHTPNCDFCTGWYGFQWTAPAGHSGPVDIEINSWPASIYPEVSHGGANNPPFGGNTRPQQLLVQKVSGGTPATLFRSTMVGRHGWTNFTGTPQYTAENNPAAGVIVGLDGDPASFQTAGGDPDAAAEINFALRSSENPNKIRLTNIDVNAGETIHFGQGAFFGANQTGFYVFDFTVQTGSDRMATQQWDLSDDFSAHGDTAEGIGPDGAWSYGQLKGGSFTSFDNIVSGGVNMGPGDDGVNPRETHAWGSSAPGWFDASSEPETGPITPGIVKDYDGNNITRMLSGDGVLDAHVGDWPGGKVALHTPSTDVDPDRTSVLRWTAPDSMTVDADIALWRLFLPASEGGDRDHEFELMLNGGTSLATGLIDDLNFDCGSGNNSSCPSLFDMDGIAVNQGDTLDLLIRPLAGATEGFIGVDFTVLAGEPSMGVAGDYNGNGIVDAGDYTIWRDTLGSTTDLRADADGNGTVEQSDYQFWRMRYGNTSGAGSANGGAVPEPTTIVLLVCGLIALSASRKR